MGRLCLPIPLRQGTESLETRIMGRTYLGIDVLHMRQNVSCPNECGPNMGVKGIQSPCRGVGCHSRRCKTALLTSREAAGRSTHAALFKSPK